MGCLAYVSLEKKKIVYIDFSLVTRSCVLRLEQTTQSLQNFDQFSNTAWGEHMAHTHCITT